MTTFSIIIPVKSLNDYVDQTVDCIIKLEFHSWELIIVTNNPETNKWSFDSRIAIIESGRVGPGDKRDIGAKVASGEILVFLDDDSYPKSDFLNIANEHFKDENIHAIGGPGITPEKNSFLQKVSGAVFLSKFSGGFPERYISMGKKKFVDDWPSVNLMVRKTIFDSIGGFNTKFWPGEDTILCSKIDKILYEPRMIVWHHRRKNLYQHLKQVSAYGLHRGFFVKKFPKNSRKLLFFIPSMFFIFTNISLFYFYLPESFQLSIKAGYVLYFMVLTFAFIQISKLENLLISIFAVMYSIPSHYFYGLNFLYGLFFKKNLVSRLR